MKRRISILTIAFVAVLSSALLPQDITGTWQGTIRTTRDYREVIKISKNGNVLKAMLFSIESQPGVSFETHPGQSFPSAPVAFRGNVIEIQFPGIGGTFQGTLSADGNSISGGLLQNGATLTLKLVRATAETAWTIPDTPPGEKSMATDANPSFELATIKPTPPDTQGGGLGPSPGGRFTAHNATLGGLLGFAYGLNRNQIENEPAWFESDRFDIVAKADLAGAPNMAQQRVMLQKLLADRLKLRFHREKKEGTVFALTTEKGSRLTPNTSDPEGPSPAEMVQQPGHWHLTVRNVNMETFASGLQGVLDRTVIDRTGLTGHFDITLDWAPDQFQSQGLGAATPTPNSGAALPDLYTALRDQLGLKPVSTKGLVEILVIDHVERPSEN